MKYEKCLSCKQLGAGCDGPNLLLMDTPELAHWLNELRSIRGASYDKTAADSGVSKTAVYSFLTSSNHECRIDTARLVSKVLIGGNCGENPCGNVTNSEKAAYEEKIRQLEHDIEWHKEKFAYIKEKCAYIETENADLKTLVANSNKHNTDSQNFLRGQIRAKNRVILILSILLGICLATIIAALIIDRTNSGVGFFWLESLFRPQGVKEGMRLIGKGI